MMRRLPAKAGAKSEATWMMSARRCGAGGSVRRRCARRMTLTRWGRR